MPTPESVHHEHHPFFWVSIALVGVLAAVGVIGLLAEMLGAETVSGSGSGSGILVIDGTSYEFTSTACFISEDEFAAAGTGYDNGQRFWVSASSANLDLSVGTESAIDQPADDQLWLISDELIDWQSAGDTVVAHAPMSDRRATDAETVVGTLELHCDPAPGPDPEADADA